MQVVQVARGVIAAAAARWGPAAARATDNTQVVARGFAANRRRAQRSAPAEQQESKSARVAGAPPGARGAVAAAEAATHRSASMAKGGAAHGALPGPTTAASPPAARCGSETAAAHHAERTAALNAAMTKLNRHLGAGTIMRLGDAPVAAPLPSTPSGCLSLDVALGGGWPRGRIVEVFGPESSGKTTLALHAIAEVQRAGGAAVLVDAEHAFNADFAARLGVRLPELLVSQPACGEEALEVVDTVLRSQGVDLVAVDSVAALLPRAEQEADICSAQVAGQARLMSQGLRRLAGTAAKSGATVMFINQLRNKVGLVFGNPEVTSGGMALKYYASVRVDVRVTERSSHGVRVRAKVVKNKVAPPYRSAEFEIRFDRGIDGMTGLLDAAEALGLIVLRGAHVYTGDRCLGQGRAAAAALLAGDSGLAEELTAAVRSALDDPAALEAALLRPAAGDAKASVRKAVG